MGCVGGVRGGGGGVRVVYVYVGGGVHVCVCVHACTRDGDNEQKM